MTLYIGIALIVLGLICWIGQSVVFFAPDVAQKFGLVELREDMDETFFIIEVESLGMADLLLAWTLPLSLDDRRRAALAATGISRRWNIPLYGSRDHAASVLPQETR